MVSPPLTHAVLARGATISAAHAGLAVRAPSGTAGFTRGLPLFLGAALVSLAVVSESLLARGPLSGIYAAYLFPVVGTLYVVAGVLAWWRRPVNRLGALMTGAGAATIVASYANSGLSEFVGIGAVIAALPLAIFIHIVHASPTGLVPGRAERVTVAAAYVVVLVLQVPIWAFTPEGPPFDAVMVAPRADLASLGHHVQQSVGAVVVVSTLWLIGRRLRTYAHADRRLLATLLGVAVLAVLVTATGKQVLPDYGFDIDQVADVQLAAAALVPIGFLLVVLRGGFARPVELRAFTRIVSARSNTVDARRELDRAVAAALGDPTSVLLRWTAGGYVDAAGDPVPVDAVGPHRAVFAIVGHEHPLGAVVYDTLLGTDPAALGAVATVVGIALERERLAREVSDSRAALQDASRRVLVAGDLERRRVAHDLHDGLQGALVLLSMRARDLARGAPDDRAACIADGLDSAARTLRSLVDGVLPAPLVERGLVAAVHDLADSLPLEVSVSAELPDLDLSNPVETTAYFIVAEAMTNVVKHAHADRAEICLYYDGNLLKIEVVDDGVGAEAYAGGSGLIGLRDRVKILGGSLEVTSPEVGTRILATLPCG